MRETARLPEQQVILIRSEEKGTARMQAAAAEDRLSDED